MKNKFEGPYKSIKIVYLSQKTKAKKEYQKARSSGTYGGDWVAVAGFFFLALSTLSLWVHHAVREGWCLMQAGK